MSVPRGQGDINIIIWLWFRTQPLSRNFGLGLDLGLSLGPVFVHVALAWSRL